MSNLSANINKYAKAVAAFLTFLATVLTTVVGVAAFAIPAAYVAVISSVIAGITVLAVAITTNTPKVVAVVDDFTDNVAPQLEDLVDDIKGTSK